MHRKVEGPGRIKEEKRKQSGPDILSRHWCELV